MPETANTVGCTSPESNLFFHYTHCIYTTYTFVLVLCHVLIRCGIISFSRRCSKSRHYPDAMLWIIAFGTLDLRTHKISALQIKPFCPIQTGCVQRDSSAINRLRLFYFEKKTPWWTGICAFALAQFIELWRREKFYISTVVLLFPHGRVYSSRSSASRSPRAGKKYI